MTLFQDINLKLYQKSAIIVFITFVSFMMGQTIIAILTQKFAPDIFSTAQKLTPNDIGKINFIKILQLVSALFSFVVPSIIINKLLSKDSLTYLAVKHSPKIWYYLLIPLFIFSLMPAMNMIIQWNASLNLPESMSSIEQQMKAMEESSGQMINLMVSGTSRVDLIINIILIGFLPALGEEFLFRGVIQRHLGEWFKNPHIAIFISAFLFSAIHFQFYGFIPRLILGMIFGYLVYFSGSIWPAVFAHFFNNTMAVIAMFFTNIGAIGNNANTFGTQKSDFFFVIFGLIMATASGFFLFRKKTT